MQITVTLAIVKIVHCLRTFDYANSVKSFDLNLEKQRRILNPFKYLRWSFYALSAQSNFRHVKKSQILEGQSL